MTTQNTHHEHDDVNASVVEQQHVSEGMTAPSTSETPTPDEGTQTQAGISASDESATPADIQAETLPETPAVSNEVPALSVDESHSTPELAPQNSYAPEATTTSNFNPEQHTPVATEEITTFPASDKASLTTVEGDEKHPRPFTDFIEEFRLAEEARLMNGNVRQEVTNDSFEPLTATPLVRETNSVSEEELFSPASAGFAFAAPLPTVEDDSAAVQQPLAEESTQEPPLPTAPPERAISPLLRPATRLRLPRHSARHVREESVAEKAAASAAANTAATPSQTEASAPVEPATEPEQPRPARRYRFDRPTSIANGSAASVPVQPAPAQRTEESRENVPNRGSLVPQNDAISTNAKPAASIEGVPAIIPPKEQLVQKPAQEVPVAESVSTPPVEHGRRHNGQERQKEQVAAVAATVADTAPPAIDTAAQPAVVAPEDLPPLEYSELQKANTRRRRRHRTSTTNGSTPAPIATEQTIPAVQSVPAVPATPPAAIAPIAPSTPAAAPVPVASPALAEAISNQYSIVSGYTVSQMNMGNEAAGPFMGPEPSPARGSLVTREGRTTRAEAQRSPIYSPARTHEAAPSSASLNHFASVISQAIQTQTDRMVAELRRDSQSPTNVSVTLPPFPSTERVGVFVDVANLLYSARTLRMAVDFGKLLDFLRGNRRLVRAHAYCPTSPQAGDEQMFLQAVKGLGYRITTKNYKTFSSGAKKADLDLDLCMDVVRLVDGRAVDCVVLVSGDSDFMPMLDYCSDHGVRVEVAAFDEAMSATLRQSCDLFINLSMLEEIRS